MKTRRYALSIAGLWAVCAQPLWAHDEYELFGRCTYQEAMIIGCIGGVNGKPLSGLRIEVLADDNRILVRGKLDALGTFRFKKPTEPFYVLIDAKPGMTVEIDDDEIK